MPSPTATEVVIRIPIDREDDGPAMSALTDMQRQFVAAMMMLGPTLERARGAAAAAGYEKPDQSAYALMRNPRVLAALKEEAGRRLVGAALMGVDVMMKIASNDQHKDQFRAAKELAAINGFTVEQKITVTHDVKDSRNSLIDQIKERAAELGVDPRPLLLQAGVQIVDAEFEDVTAVEDWTKT